MYFVHSQTKFNPKIIPSFLTLNNLNLQSQNSFFPGKKIIFTDTGRSALQLIIENLNLSGSTILMPAYICGDVFYPLLKKYDLRPIFIDADPKTFNIDLSQLEAKITAQTSAILISHIYGLPNDMDKIISFARRRNLMIIEDCAHSFGARYRGVSVGNFGRAALFSLYKTFPIARGGMLVCPQDWPINLPPSALSPRNLLSIANGFPSLASFFKKIKPAAPPNIPSQAELMPPRRINGVSLNLFSQLLGAYDLRARRGLAQLFQNELVKLGFQVQEPSNNVFCYFSALIPESISGKRDALINELSARGVFATAMWRQPLILHPGAPKAYNIELARFPNTAAIARRIINLPLQNFYQEKDIHRIIKIIISSINSI